MIESQWVEEPKVDGLLLFTNKSILQGPPSKMFGFHFLLNKKNAERKIDSSEMNELGRTMAITGQQIIDNSLGIDCCFSPENQQYYYTFICMFNPRANT